MKSLRIAPSGATRTARVPTMEARAPHTTHQEEGPASRVAGASECPARAGASLEPSGSPPSSWDLVRLDFGNDASIAEWLRLVRGVMEDLIVLACEGSRRMKHRVLSRAAIGRQAREAERCVRQLLGEADESLVRRAKRSGEVS